MIQIQIWGDFECPYSYFQALTLKQLKGRYGDQLELIWRAYELNPTQGTMPPPAAYMDNLNVARMEPIVAEHNLTLLAPPFLTYAWLAQESACFANRQGLALPLAVSIFEAVFSRGVDISNEDEIMKIAAQVGVDTSGLREAIDNGALTKHVMKDEDEFKTYGFQGVPAMLIGEKNFSPKSFIPVTGYKTADDVVKLIPQKLL
ncbi:MAG: DsbA family protein [Polynucleobacter sp.]|nr:DsbA family protein [Polynucleobacter sp.]MDZ4056746.1 DsbA family protein [Polynucleobacter sp.]